MAKVASALAVIQPAVSQAIALLAAAIGVPMLERSPAGVTPTEFGEAMLRHALDMLDALSGGMREVEALSDPTGGSVTAIQAFIAMARAAGLETRYQRPDHPSPFATSDGADAPGLDDRDDERPHALQDSSPALRLKPRLM